MKRLFDYIRDNGVLGANTELLVKSAVNSGNKRAVQNLLEEIAFGKWSFEGDRAVELLNKYIY